MKTLNIAAVAFVVMLGCKDKADEAAPVAAEASAEQEPAAPEAPEPEPEAQAEQRMKLADALAIAAKKYPDAPAIEVEIEIEGAEEEEAGTPKQAGQAKSGRELLEVEFLVDDGIKEVYLDPNTGEVVKEADETLTDEEKAGLPALRKALADSGVTLAQMISMAESKYDESKIREVELEMHDGKLIMEVGVVEGDETVDWIHDPKTGESLGREQEEHKG